MCYHLKFLHFQTHFPRFLIWSATAETFRVFFRVFCSPSSLLRTGPADRGAAALQGVHLPPRHPRVHSATTRGNSGPTNKWWVMRDVERTQTRPSALSYFTQKKNHSRSFGTEKHGTIIWTQSARQYTYLKMRELVCKQLVTSTNRAHIGHPDLHNYVIDPDGNLFLVCDCFPRVISNFKNLKFR